MRSFFILEICFFEAFHTPPRTNSLEVCGQTKTCTVTQVWSWENDSACQQTLREIPEKCFEWQIQLRPLKYMKVYKSHWKSIKCLFPPAWSFKDADSFSIDIRMMFSIIIDQFLLSGSSPKHSTCCCCCCSSPCDRHISLWLHQSNSWPIPGKYSLHLKKKNNGQISFTLRQTPLIYGQNKQRPHLFFFIIWWALRNLLAASMLHPH